MFVVGSIVTTLLPLLPGVEGAVITPTTPIGVGAGSGASCVCAGSTGSPAGPAHAPRPVVGALCAEVAMHDNGGAASPARFLLMLVVVYTAYFFPSREAWPYLGLVLVLHALPLTYDPHALSKGLLGELLIVGPCYWLLAFLLITGKRGMVALRAHADDLARRDPLTGLANRRALLEAAARPGQLGLLLLDVDDFKRFNTRTAIPAATARWRRGRSLRRACGRGPARPPGRRRVRRAGGRRRRERHGCARRARHGAVRTERTARVSAGWAIGAGDADAAAGRRPRPGRRQARWQGPRARRGVEEATSRGGASPLPCRA